MSPHTPPRPLLAAALFCQRVRIEEDGRKSVINITDQAIVTFEGKDPPTVMPPVVWKGALFVKFIRGSAVAEHTVGLRITTPDGREIVNEERVIHFRDHASHSVDVIFEIEMGLRMPGTHWLAISCDGEPATRVPLDVIYRVT